MSKDSASQTDREIESTTEVEAKASCAVSHAVPASQPDSVQQIAPPLLTTYQVDGGHVHLVGCQLHRVPVVRIAASDATETAAGTKEPIARYFVFPDKDPDGCEASTALLRQLGLANVLPIKRPGSISPARVQEVVRLAFSAANIAVHDEENWQVSVIWCKQVDGKLEFTIGDASVELAFDGWAATLAGPAYHCDVTDVDTFHLAATTDGRIVAAEQLETCGTSGELLPCNEIVECAATKRRVATHLTTRCPASGLPVQTDWLVSCSMCQQQVSPASLAEGRCTSCRNIESVQHDDPRIASILGTFPELTGWQWLSLAESETAQILVAAGLWQKWLLVVERNSGTLVHAARSHRFSREWQPVMDLSSDIDL